MARPGLTKHRKFGRLARRLGSAVLARGVLELLWDHCYESGDPFVGDADDIGYAVGWHDDAQALAAALVDCGFLDPVDDGYAVHDLFDHAPDYVLKRRRRELERQQRGAERRRTADTGRRSDENGRTPSPSPSPSHKDQDHTPVADKPRQGARDAGDAGDDGFEAFWAIYPRHIAKAVALKHWRKLKPSPPMQAIILNAVTQQKTWRTWADPRYIPHPANWLHDRRWDDERPADERPRGPTATFRPWCEHDPPCHTQAEHTAKCLAEMRQAQEVPA